MSGQQVTCAVYSRKSSEEGLEQDFNSLDAQHEACLAYIASQKQEGWVASERRYADGGFSGGTLERPGIKALLADVSAGLVKVIVVYKVDRLTRALSDFARLVELFDEKGVSFVSVTQQFNTTTSMGRLTLNVLLSFAQFEREVTGERIRDKIAASKKRGLWMGGRVPLGYDPKGRTLEINEAEAKTVQQIYERYLALGSVRALKEELESDGLRGKNWVNRKGESVGGKAFSRGALYHILRNPLYRGRIRHKGLLHDGLHAPIIDQALWKAVQQFLEANRQGGRHRLRGSEPYPLRGLLVDPGGRAFTTSHAAKAGRRYRYYLAADNSALNQGGKRLRLPAGEIEGAVLRATKRHLSDSILLNESLELGLDPHACERLRPDIEAFGAKLDEGSQTPRWQQLVHRVVLEEERLCIELRADAVRDALSAALSKEADTFQEETSPNARISLEEPIRLQRRGAEVFVITPQEPLRRGAPDPALISAIARAQRWREQLIAGERLSLEAIAEAVGLSRRYVGRILHLACLAPDIVEAILSGQQRPELLQEDLLKRLPIAWDAQRRLLGYEPL
ncbi:recombinase family protein [Limibacillus sp. MBR-115]|uniref:recombinase family protein n=1 Tax=Limibacillus sp. MBR-115 TaxID=3156465 RepID=UPI0033992032